MSLGIVHYNEPVLRRKGVKIDAFGDPLVKFADEMVEVMHRAAGIGLAAQQVGRAIQLCVIDLRSAEQDFAWELDGARPPLDLFMPMVVVNPEIAIPTGALETVYEEGCLSFPKIRGDVKRPSRISARFQDQHGVPHTLVCDGLLARCVLHEADHLNGILFIDRMDKKVRAGIDEAVKALARETRETARKQASQ